MHKDQVVGGYVLLDKIGAGGMGEVWRARQPRVDRIVVVKGLKQGADASMRRRFENEMLALVGAEHHPNIVPFIAPIVEGDDLYLAMRYVAGPNLRQRMEQEPPLTADDKVAILTEVLSALVHLHENVDVLHRDLKPANILLDKEGRVYLADFGLAKFQDPEITHTRGPGWGTPDYAAP